MVREKAQERPSWCLCALHQHRPWGICLCFLHVSPMPGTDVSVGQWASASLHPWSVQGLFTWGGADRQFSLQSLPVLTPCLDFHKAGGCSPSCPLPNIALGLQPEADLSDGSCLVCTISYTSTYTSQDFRSTCSGQTCMASSWDGEGILYTLPINGAASYRSAVCPFPSIQGYLRNFIFLSPWV